MQRNKKKSILFLTPYPQDKAPSQRLKFEQYFSRLKAEGYVIAQSPFYDARAWEVMYKKGAYWAKLTAVLRGYNRRLRDLAILGQYQVIYVHLWGTPIGLPFYEHLIRLLSQKLVYDIDDMVHLGHSSDVNKKLSNLKGRVKMRVLARQADHVITCTPALDAWARQYNSHTSDISSTVDMDAYQIKSDYIQNESPILGWSGSHSTSKYLYLLKDMLRDLAKTMNFKLLVVGDADFDIQGVHVEAHAWSAEREVELLQRMDIGLYPLPDEPWVHGKSGLKAIQYMAVGIPVLASGIGANHRVVVDGETGYLIPPGNMEVWKQKITYLLQHADERSRLGRNGHERTASHFSVQQTFQQYLRVLRDVSNMKNLLIMVPYPHGEAPSQRFRIEQYLDYLIMEGFSYNYSPFWDMGTWKRMYRRGGYGQKFLGLLRGYFRRISSLFYLQRYNAVYLHREATPIGPPIIEWFIARVWGKKLIFDFDDAIWLPNNSLANQLMVKRLKFHRKTAKIIGWSWRVSAGNQFLADFAQQYNSNVRIIPTTIDTENHHNRVKDYSKSKGNPLVIGWTGSHSTLKQLEQVYDVLEHFYFEHGIRFRVICDKPPTFRPSWVEFVKWRKSSEIDDLLGIDIGIMPLYNTDWERGKCGFKALQYQALGIPAIGSDVGVNKLVIKHSLSGIITAPGNKNNWKEALEAWFNDGNLLEKYSANARQYVEQNYSVNRWKKEVSTLLRC